MSDVKTIIQNRSGNRGQIRVSAAGGVFKGTVVDAAQLGDDYFSIQTVRTAVPKAEGERLDAINIPYSAVAWWMDL